MQKSYIITLEGMEFHAFHGCYELERKTGSHFEVSLRIETPIGEVADTDDVSKAVNYLNVYQCVKEQMSISSHTIERVASNIIQALKSGFPQILHVECKVCKIAPPLGGKIKKVSVTLAD